MRTASLRVVSLALALGASAASAQPRIIDLGEPQLPDGAFGQVIPVDGARPVGDVGVLRSSRAPVCVHVGEGVTPETARDTLRFAEEALDALEYRLGLPLPLGDGTRGGTNDLDVYLRTDGPLSETVPDVVDPAWLWDRASAFVRVRTTSDARALRRHVTEALVRAAVLGVKADHPPTFVSALGSTVARWITGDTPDLASWRAFQRNVHRSIFARRERTDEESRGASLFLDHLTRRWDDESHALLKGLLWAPVQHTPRGSALFWDEPDLFDVARRVFRDERGGVRSMLLEFAAARSLVGTPADAFNLAGGFDESLGTTPVRTLRFSQLPAWVTPTEALEPTGSATVVIDLFDAPLVRPAMAVWFHGSPWQRWMVRAVRVSNDGRPVAELDSEVITQGEWSTQFDVLDVYREVRIVILALGDESYDPDVPANPNGFFALNIAPVR